MGMSQFVRTFMDPYVEFFRFIPPIAFVTLAVIWFGLGETSKIVLIVYTTLFMVAINTMIGVLGVEPDKRFAALCLGASRTPSFFPRDYSCGRSEHRHRHEDRDGQQLHDGGFGGDGRRQVGRWLSDFQLAALSAHGMDFRRDHHPGTDGLRHRPGTAHLATTLLRRYDVRALGTHPIAICLRSNGAYTQ